MKNRTRTLGMAGLAMLALLTPSLTAAVPGAFHYQGRLVLDGAAVNGVVDMAFRLYDAAEGGTLLYEDNQSVSVIDGVYSIYIGAANPLPAEVFRDHQDVYLELAVDGATLAPRERIVSVGYAFAARYAQEAAVAHSLTSDAPVASVLNPTPEPQHVDSNVNVSFFAHRNGMDQSIGTNGEKKVFWQAEEFDTANAFDLVGDRFVVPVDGTYRLTVQALLDPPAPPKTDPPYLGKIVITKNSTTRLSVYVVRFREGASLSLATSRDALLETGDVIEVYVGHTLRSAASLSGESYHTFFSGFLLHE